MIDSSLPETRPEHFSLFRVSETCLPHANYYFQINFRATKEGGDYDWEPTPQQEEFMAAVKYWSEIWAGRLGIHPAAKIHLLWAPRSVVPKKDCPGTAVVKSDHNYMQAVILFALQDSMDLYRAVYSIVHEMMHYVLDVYEASEKKDHGVIIPMMEWWEQLMRMEMANPLACVELLNKWADQEASDGIDTESMD